MRKRSILELIAAGIISAAAITGCATSGNPRDEWITAEEKANQTPSSQSSQPFYFEFENRLMVLEHKYTLDYRGIPNYANEPTRNPSIIQFIQHFLPYNWQLKKNGIKKRNLLPSYSKKRDSRTDTYMDFVHHIKYNSKFRIVPEKIKILVTIEGGDCDKYFANDCGHNVANRFKDGSRFEMTLEEIE